MNLFFKYYPQQQQQSQQQYQPQIVSEKQPLLEEHQKSLTNSIKVTQHNIENATRSSIILQPPTSQHTINSPLFAHLGQVRYNVKVSSQLGSK